jgi:hypothetical protein
MSKVKRDILWTIKVDKSFDDAVQKTVAILGYKSKAELAREAIREFLIRHKLYSLLGGEPIMPVSMKTTPKEALERIQEKLKNIPLDVIDAEARAARDDVAKELLGEDD